VARTGEYPQARLACIHGERHREHVFVATTTVRYSLSDIPVPRPATGVVEATVASGSGESRLRVRVFSSATRRRWKVARFGLSLLGALIATPSILRLIALDTLDGTDSLPYVVPMLTNVLRLGAVLAGAPFLFAADGISSAKPRGYRTLLTRPPRGRRALTVCRPTFLHLNDRPRPDPRP
jgi:hypothetical protein